MRKLCGLGVGALLCFAGNALAAEGSASDQKAGDAKKEEADTDYGHGKQFGLRAGVVGGYRMVFRYDNSPYCNDPDPKKLAKDQQKFCGFGAPLALDAAASFALIDGLEPFIWGRFGLQDEKKTDTKPLLVIGIGTRVYTMSDSAFKVFIEPAIGYELEGGRRTLPPQFNDKAYKQDLVFHLAAGPQYDFAKYVGLYLDAGLTTGILRSINSTMELMLGLQFRAP